MILTSIALELHLFLHPFKQGDVRRQQRFSKAQKRLKNPSRRVIIMFVVPGTIWVAVSPSSHSASP